ELKSELPNPGSTYDLTEGNDNLKGTDLDDTFNGTTYVGNGTNKSTLSAFDKIDGGAGRDTLNVQVLANNSASDAKLKGEDLVKALAGVTNVESVNIVTDLSNDTAITLNSGSTGMVNLGLDVLGGKLTGLTTDISGKLNIKANGSVDALSAASAKSVNVNAAGAVTLSDTDAATSISVDANGAGAVTLTKANSVENLSVKNATNLTITTGGDKLNTVTLENVTLGDSGSAAAAINFKGATTLNFNNVNMINGSDSKIAHITSTAETLNLNFSGKDATFALVTNTVTKVANITANADSNNFLITKADGSKDPTHADLQNDSFTTFIVKGSGKELLLDAGDLDNVTSIDASGFSGNAKIAFGDSNADAKAGLKVSSGSGNDTLVLESNKLSAGSVIDGGAGNDTIIMKASALADAATLGMIKNIENVTVSDALSANTDVSASSFVNIGLLGDNAGGGTDAILTINKDQIVDIQTAKLAENKKVTIKLNDATGTDDAVNIVLNAKAIIGADKSVAVGANDAAKLLVIDSAIETVNITSVAKDSFTANTLTMQVSTDGTSGANKVVVTGDGAITITAATAATDLKTIKDLDASALTGKLTFDASVNKLASGAAIKGGSGDDIITVGYDTQVVTLGAGNDTVKLTIGAADKTQYTTITDFSKGDKIDASLVKASGQTEAKNDITKIAGLTSTSTFDDYLKKALEGDGSTNAKASYFQFNGDTYVVIDTANAAVADSLLTKATDGLIKLAGFTGDLAIDANSLITVA
ncbi:hypothetical protein CFT12S02855_08650, partial [Campylobacter fetus subsp. testudinum]|uniref:beta strand repeat-containing protein n=1 Tax=Campylobacter fetus TaxID=196 RepID=UPI0008188F1F